MVSRDACDNHASDTERHCLSSRGARLLKACVWGKLEGEAAPKQARTWNPGVDVGGFIRRANRPILVRFMILLVNVAMALARLPAQVLKYLSTLLLPAGATSIRSWYLQVASQLTRVPASTIRRDRKETMGKVRKEIVGKELLPRVWASTKNPALKQEAFPRSYPDLGSAGGFYVSCGKIVGCHQRKRTMTLNQRPRNAVKRGALTAC